MDHSLFDDLTRSVASSTSRRQALKFLTTTLAGGLFLGARNATGNARSSTPKSSRAPSNGGVVSSSGPAMSIDPDFGTNTFELLSYQKEGYRFKIIPLDARPPTGFERLGFDDTAFGTGRAAFGSAGDCFLQSTVKTTWQIDSQLIVRHKISIPQGATAVRIMLSVDNDIIGVFFNGEQIAGFTSHEGCPDPDEFQVNVPQRLVKTGDDIKPENNLVAVHVLDRGVESYFDMRVLAEMPVTAMVATLDRAASAAQDLLPLVPISNIKVACGSTSSSTNAFNAFPAPSGAAEPDETTISFLSEQTGQIGEMRIRQNLTESTLATRTRYLVDGNFLVTSRTQQGIQDGSVRISVDFAPNLIASLTDKTGQAQFRAVSLLQAFDSLVMRTSVVEDFSRCVALQQLGAPDDPGKEPGQSVERCGVDCIRHLLFSEGPGIGAAAVSGGAGAAAIGTLNPVGAALGLFAIGVDAVGGFVFGTKGSDDYSKCTSCCDKGCGSNICTRKRKSTRNDPEVCQTARA
jgi:hypothetical protein